MLPDFVFEHFLYFAVCTSKLKSLKSGLVIASGLMPKGLPVVTRCLPDIEDCLKSSQSERIRSPDELDNSVTPQRVPGSGKMNLTRKMEPRG